MSDPSGESAPDPEQPKAPFLNLMTLAERLGQLCWLERQIFELLGKWSIDASDEFVVVGLDDHALRHARIAEVLFARMPELSNVDSERLAETPDPHDAATISILGEQIAVVERLTGMYRVLLSHLIVRYQQIVDQVGDVGSPSARRSLESVIEDLIDQQAWGEAKLSSILESSDEYEAELSVQQKLEAALQAR